MKTDSQLRDDVQAELDWDASFDGRDIGVAVKNGVVTLTGHVNSYAERLAAQNAAGSVSGVQAIANELEVRLMGDAQRSDTDIAEAALTALKANVVVPSGIKVVIHDGWMTLNGEVSAFYQKKAAEHAVHYLRGLRGVTNNITIKPKASATNIKQKIESAFQRHAHRDAEKISVAVNDGTVTLIGEVHTWQERQEAEDAAWRAPGVIKVKDHLVIRP